MKGRKARFRMDGNPLGISRSPKSPTFPTKSLRIFSTLNCATISLATFFRYQSAYLFPAIRQVYERHQNSLLAELKEKGNLVVAGDGRADSPGHSAKYGTYSLIDLTCNKVVDFKLVQVCSHCDLLHAMEFY